MKFFKWFFSLFSKGGKTKNIQSHLDKKNPNGQELIYWRNYINRNNLTKIFLPLISLFIFTTILIISIKPITEAEIYSDNFKYDIYGVTRGSNNDKIIHSLSMYNYEESFKLLSEALKEDSTQNIHIFYYSIIAMELNNHDIAQKYLKKLINNDNLFLDDAQWFLALSYLKTNKEMSIIEFRKISIDKNHYKQKKAKEILKELE